MHVCQLIAPGPMAGAENVVLAGCEALGRRGIEVSLVVLDERRTPECAPAFVARARAVGLHPIEIGVNGRVDVAAFRSLTRTLADLGPDVLHVHGYKALAYALPSAPSRVPVFATHHGDTSHTSQVQLYEQLARSLYTATRCVFAVSEETAHMLQELGLPRGRVRVVENPIGLSAPASLPPRRARDGRTRVLFLGRLSAEKGVDDLLSALREVADQGAWEIRVAGAGSERSKLEGRVAQLGLSRSVTFLGHRGDVGALLEWADMLVLPSLREGLPLAALEAASYGVPIVASEVGGLPSLIEHEVTGLLVPPARPDKLARALEHLRAHLDDFTWATRARARSVRMRFSSDRWVEGTLAAYAAGAV